MEFFIFLDVKGDSEKHMDSWREYMFSLSMKCCLSSSFLKINFRLNEFYTFSAFSSWDL